MGRAVAHRPATGPLERLVRGHLPCCPRGDTGGSTPSPSVFSTAPAGCPARPRERQAHRVLRPPERRNRDQGSWLGSHPSECPARRSTRLRPSPQGPGGVSNLAATAHESQAAPFSSPLPPLVAATLGGPLPWEWTKSQCASDHYQVWGAVLLGCHVYCPKRPPGPLQLPTLLPATPG